MPRPRERPIRPDMPHPSSRMCASGLNMFSPHKKFERDEIHVAKRGVIFQITEKFSYLDVMIKGN